MSDFSKTTFEPPGYPIYKAFIMPYRQGKSLLDVVEVTAGEVEKWREMLRRLKGFLSRSMIALSKSGKKLKDYEELEILGDLISLFLRAPLNREILPSVAPSPLRAYAFMKLTGFGELFEEQKRLRFDPLEFTFTFYAFYSKCLKDVSEEGEWYSELARVLNELETTEVVDLLESCWLLIPADTRPVFNVSSLISHLLLTSAIAWSIAINKGVEDRGAIARLRLAALLHDIGKPFKYRHHVETSIEVAKELLEDLLPEEEVKWISNLIEEHHHPKTELGNIIKDADELASAIDRLKRLLNELFKGIKDRLEDAVRSLNYDDFEKAFNSWDFWQRVYEKYDRNIIKNLSEDFVREVRRMTKNFTMMPPKVDVTGEAPRNIRVVLIDVGRIQNFIYRSHSLKHVAAASLVVNSLVMAYIVAYLQWAMSEKYWFPYESFLYTAGGNVELLVPGTLLKDVEHEVSRLRKSLMMKYGVPLHIASAELYENYARTIEELMTMTSLNKLSVDRQRRQVSIPKVIQRGVRNVCQLCFMEPPTTKVQTPEGEMEVCEVCSRLNDIGLNIHFKERYESKFSIYGRSYSPRDVLKLPWSEEEVRSEGLRIKASDKVMEIIAGHDFEELRELGKLARTRNIAVIKVDGALMGLLMATCLSIADAYERSARIDLALKKAIETSVYEVYNGVLKGFSEDEAAGVALSIKMGILYAGGDDAVILAPSWTSPLIALILGKEFLYDLGCVRGLSIGVAVASLKANIWALIDASSKLMEKAKGKARSSIRNGSAESTICFDVVEVGDLSGSTVNERFSTLKRERLTAQPLGIKDFEEMLCRVLAQGQGSSESAYSYSDIAHLSYLVSRNVKILEQLSKAGLIEEVKKVQRNLKKIRDAIGETLQAAKSMVSKAGGIGQYSSYVFPIAYIYACRQVARLEDRPYEFVKSFIPDDLDSSSSLSDVDRLIKIVGGGLI